MAYLAKLQAQASKLGVAERSGWSGMVQGDIKWGAFCAAEVFCLQSHQENFGIVVVEAPACGKPVLISNTVINLWREIDADLAGFVDTDMVLGTVSNLQRWLALSASAYAAMSDRALKTFKTRFHIERAAQRLLEIVREVKTDASRHHCAIGTGHHCHSE